jgi:hypothetical protein
MRYVPVDLIHKDENDAPFLSGSWNTFLMCLSKGQDVYSVTHTHTNQTELPQLFHTELPIAITTKSSVR